MDITGTLSKCIIKVNKIEEEDKHITVKVVVRRQDIS